MKAQLIFISFLILGSNLLNAQQLLRDVVSVQGNSFGISLGQSDYIVQQCIGQGSPISSWNTDRFTVHQGFLQPLLKADLKGVTQRLELSVYPNPTSQVVHIATDVQSSNRIDLQLFDLSGRLIIAQNIATENAELDLSSLPAGAYVLQCKLEGLSATTTIIKH